MPHCQLDLEPLFGEAEARSEETPHPVELLVGGCNLPLGRNIRIHCQRVQSSSNCPSAAQVCLGPARAHIVLRHRQGRRCICAGLEGLDTIV